MLHITRIHVCVHYKQCFCIKRTHVKIIYYLSLCTQNRHKIYQHLWIKGSNIEAKKKIYIYVYYFVISCDNVYVKYCIFFLLTCWGVFRNPLNTKPYDIPQMPSTRNRKTNNAQNRSSDRQNTSSDTKLNKILLYHVVCS